MQELQADKVKFTTRPKVLVLTTEHINSATIHLAVEIMDLGNEMHQLWLVGSIYFAQEHFTSE